MLARRVGWARRVGVAAALVVLAGAGMAFAGQVFEPDRAPLEPSRTRPVASLPSAPNAARTPDDVAPAIRIAYPQPGTTVYGATETLRGRTEADATVKVFDETGGGEIPATTSPDGRFTAELDLQTGDNQFVVRAEDSAGNRASARLVITRAVSQASIVLAVSVAELALADLPTSVDLTAQVDDELGLPASGADVTFSLSPPNRGTATYRTTSADGVAEWRGVPVSGDARALGTWLVTVLAVLESGAELRGDATLNVY